MHRLFTYPQFSSPSFLMLFLLFFLVYLLVFKIMIIKGGTSQACAACKYQRRRCYKECALAPYFPADKPKMFQNAHRLYGVSNILKILKKVHPTQKEETMMSIIYESDMRARFPVYGCLWVISELERQLNRAMEELRYVTTRLSILKDQCYYQMSPLSNETAKLYGQNHHHRLAGEAMMGPLSPNDFVMNGNNGGGGVFAGSDDRYLMKPLKITQRHQQHGYYNNSISIQSYDYDDIPFHTIVEDGQSYIESKEACESSAESTLKDTTQPIHHVIENELRTAAACLTLTGVN